MLPESYQVITGISINENEQQGMSAYPCCKINSIFATKWSSDNIAEMEWSACSLDLNPMENLRGFKFPMFIKTAVSAITRKISEWQS